MKNFLATNKQSIQAKATTSRSQNNYRMEHSVFTPRAKGRAFVEYQLPNEDFAYGKPNDYSHRMNYLIGSWFN